MGAMGKTEVELAQASGHVLREDLQADRDLPPFNRSTFDGIAIASKAFREGTRTFAIQGTALAGSPRLSLDSPEQCVEIMTGSPLPDEADCVVKIEDLKIENGQATILDPEQAESGHGIHELGSDCSKGETLLKAGVTISPKEIAVAASIGKATVQVSTMPRIAIIATGDELVPVDSVPEPHQIRRSNDLTLATALNAAGYTSTTRLHLDDDPSEIEATVSKLLESEDVLILAGGISKGKRDYLPETLLNQGVDRKFQWVSQRPGKPLWFGTFQRDHHDFPVFALPGNPVSCFTCLHRYVLPALDKWLARTPKAQAYAQIQEETAFHPPLSLFLPAFANFSSDGAYLATPVPFNTSGDFISVSKTDGFIELPKERTHFSKGDTFKFYPWVS